MSIPNEDFGSVSRAARIAAGFGLRAAAIEMGISATYLSRVENRVDPPSADLIRKMARLYHFPLERLINAANRPMLSDQVRGNALNSQEHLRALYRLAIEQMISEEDLNDFLRLILKKRGDLTEAQVELELIRLRQELPRTHEREGLVASDIKPRYLRKRDIAAIAYGTLESYGLGQRRYELPTPIDQIVDAQPGIKYSISDELPSKVVLGLSRWNVAGEREILINSSLDDQNGTNPQRFNFTLGHELFHAIEHLPLAQSRIGHAELHRVMFVERDLAARRSPAQRAVDRWASGRKSPALLTNEDWREWQANTFSSCILMPEWAVIEEFQRRIDVEFVTVKSAGDARQQALEIAGENFFGDSFHISLSDAFGVSRQAMAIRLLDLNLVQEVDG